jgi:hypothetical protein
MKTVIALSLATMFSSTALAQDESRQSARNAEADLVREVERGMFMKAGTGSTQYIGAFNGILRPVIGLDLSVGQDFVDQQKLSVAWEVVFNQALQNGPKRNELSSLPTNALIQGDIHTFSVMAMLEGSAYVTSRFGIGIRGGAGMTMVPKLVDFGVYESEIQGGDWAGQPALAHEGPLPTFGGGPTIEYYTKLSHFSVGLDANVLYIIDLDLGINMSGYLKYTF